MDRFYQLLNAGMVSAPEKHRRIWIEPGVPVVLGPRLAMTIFFDCHDYRYIQRAVIDTPDKSLDYELPEATWVDLSAYCGLMAIPRAVELVQPGKPKRILMEFAATREDVQWALP